MLMKKKMYLNIGWGMDATEVMGKRELLTKNFEKPFAHCLTCDINNN